MKNVLVFLLVVFMLVFSTWAMAGNQQTLGQGDPKCPKQTTSNMMLGQGDPKAPVQTSQNMLLGQGDPGVPKNVYGTVISVPLGTPMIVVSGSRAAPAVIPVQSGQILIPQQ